MGNCGAYLGLNIVTNDRQSSLSKSALPIAFTGNKDRHAIDEATAGSQYLFHIPFGCLFASYWQIVDHHISLGLFEYIHNICSWARCLSDDLRQILAQSIVGHTSVNSDARLGHVAEFNGVVRLGVNSLS